VKITRVTVHTAPMAFSWLTDSLIANPMSAYAAYRERRSSWFGAMTAAVVEIEGEDGRTGLGYAGGGRGGAVREVIDSHLASLLTGQEAFDLELRWEQMYRASLMYAGGLAMEAISGIDLALWDLLGKALGQPVYRLLGGKTKERIPAYVTGNLTERHLAEGFRSVKIALPHAPADGREGFRQNVALLEATRRRIGDEGDLMVDCYQALDVRYAIELARAARDLRVLWLEEPFGTRDVDSLLRLKDAVPEVWYTAGEHLYSRWEFRELVERRAVDVLQPDIYRAGGVSELRKIAAYASVHHLPVIPHGIGAPTYHFVAATNNSPRAEFVDVFAQGGELLLEGEPQPAGGWIDPGEEPGFGYRLNQRALRGEVAVAPIW
jgi:L-rhamnonate dehydratase